MLHNQERIFLIGPMGAGKTTVGKALALVSSMPFVDLDDEIVRAQGRSIPEIFKSDGESGFRLIETDILKKFCKVKAVIATGGGIVTTPCNLPLLKDNGLVIFLNADPEIQYQRTAHDNNRPNACAKDRRARLKELFLIRKPLYDDACDLTFDSGALSVRDCAAAIMDKLEELSWKQSK